MVRGELIKKLFLRFFSQDEQGFREIGNQIASEEYRKGNTRLAKDLEQILDAERPATPGPFGDPDLGLNAPANSDTGNKLIDVLTERHRLSEIVLPDDQRDQIRRILDETAHAAMLRAHGLSPRSKLLFCGPPGCGKTLCAKIVASELGFPLAYVRFDSLITSYMGETATNLRKVFDFVAEGPWVLLFDEFDAIGKGRNDPNEHGELKRVVNSFLQQLDRFRSNSLLIAATNHERLLDSALWRRFDDIVTFPRPEKHEIKSLVDLKMRNFPHSGLALDSLSDLLAGMSHSDIENICLDSIKTALIQGDDKVDGKIFKIAVQRYSKRVDLSVGSVADGHMRKKAPKVDGKA